MFSLLYSLSAPYVPYVSLQKTKGKEKERKSVVEKSGNLVVSLFRAAKSMF